MSTPESEHPVPETDTDDDDDAVADLEAAEDDDVKGGKKGDPKLRPPHY